MLYKNGKLFILPLSFFFLHLFFSKGILLWPCLDRGWSWMKLQLLAFPAWWLSRWDLISGWREVELLVLFVFGWRSRETGCGMGGGAVLNQTYTLWPMLCCSTRF